MKNYFWLFLSIFLILAAPAWSGPFAYQINELRAAPEETSLVIYQIPIEVKLLNISDDLNWYQVRLSYNLGPFRYEYVGWTDLPVAAVFQADETALYNFNSPIKKLYAEPTPDSPLVLEIPIEVCLLGVAENANWYKVKIAYNLGPFEYTYIGWANIPVGDTYLAREK
jgi:hypothetical protein